MKILSTVGKAYYTSGDAIEPMYFEFTQPLAKLGHTVEHFDHMKIKKEAGPDVCGERFIETVKNGNYDVVFYQTAGEDHMTREAIGEAARYAPIAAWNSDDDWQWDSYTSHVYPYFTFMVTTYPHIYEANRQQYPKLILSQWGCLDTFAEPQRKKDLGFTFAGQIYGDRALNCAYLRRRAGLKLFGWGTMKVKYPYLHTERFQQFLYDKRWGRLTIPFAIRLPQLQDKAINFIQVNEIWNRSKISYTPMASSVDPRLYQIKSRVFEMGMSRTLMLCELSPNLERYYEPQKEFVPFTDLDDCADKAKYYLKHESERARIANAYYERTRAEHMWEHRYQQLFRDMGLEKP